MGAVALPGRIDPGAGPELTCHTSWASLARLAYRDHVDRTAGQPWPVHQPHLDGSCTGRHIGLNDRSELAI